MSIQVATIYQATKQGVEMRRNSSLRRSDSTASRLAPLDSYEPSRPLEDSEDRKSIIENIKARVAGGYYNRPDIVDDISDAFAKYFDKAIR